jgi:hypothetical protein
MPDTRRSFQMSLGRFVDYVTVSGVPYTDISSNTVTLETDRCALEEKEVSALRERRWDECHLRAFLHEATHHASFDSVVGLSFMALWAASAALPVEAITASARHIRDLACLRFAYELYGPLWEGLAVFAEHELIAGDSPLETRVLKASTELFAVGKHQLLPLEQRLAAGPDRLFSEMVRRQRSSEAWTRSKVWLLRQPLTSTPYLLGYLTVKAMHRSLSALAPMLQEPDFFLLFMLDYWLGDYEMCRRLTELSAFQSNWGALRLEDAGPNAFVEIGESIGRVGEHFQDRFDLLYARAGAFAQECLVRLLTYPDEASIRHLVSHRGGARSYQNHEPRDVGFEAEMRIGLRTAPLQINIFWQGLWETRTHLRVSVTRVFLRTTAGLVEILDRDGGRLIKRCPAINSEAEGKGEGSVEVILLNDQKTMAIAVLTSEGALAVYDVDTGQWNPPGLVQQLEYMRSFLHIEGAMNAFYQAQVTSPGSAADEMVNYYRVHGADCALHVFPQLICRGGGDPVRLKAALEQEGFAGLLASEELLEGAAKVSMICGTATVDSAEIATMLGVSHGEIVSLLQRINERTQSAFGLPVFPHNENGYSSRI